MFDHKALPSMPSINSYTKLVHINSDISGYAHIRRGQTHILLFYPSHRFCPMSFPKKRFNKTILKLYNKNIILIFLQ